MNKLSLPLLKLIACFSTNFHGLSCTSQNFKAATDYSKKVLYNILFQEVIFKACITTVEGQINLENFYAQRRFSTVHQGDRHWRIIKIVCFSIGLRKTPNFLHQTTIIERLRQNRYSFVVSLQRSFGDVKKITSENDIEDWFTINKDKIENYEKCLLYFISKKAESKHSDEPIKPQTNQIYVLPNYIGLFTNLNILNLNEHKLFCIPKEIACLRKLYSLSLSNNAFTVFPESICCLKQLKILDLSKNFIRCLPKSFKKLKNLTFLNLSNNLFYRFPKEIFAIKKIDMLEFSFNFFEAIPKEISKLHALDLLLLEGNPLKDLPSSLKDCQQLRGLSLRNCFLTRIPDVIFSLTSLHQLILSSNYLTDLPRKISNLTELQILYLEENFITELPIDELIELSQLADLGLDSHLGDPKIDSFQLDVNYYDPKEGHVLRNAKKISCLSGYILEKIFSYIGYHQAVPCVSKRFNIIWLNRKLK